MANARTTRIRTQRRWGTALLIALVAAVGVIAGTSLNEPPRFDGAGYAMLGRSILGGHGYRDIDHPDTPPHGHFPPGYPVLLAATWAVTGRSIAVAHLVSIACTVGAVVVSWAWFHRIYPARVALLLGLALAMNWTWRRAGGSIRSEPPYLLLQQLVLLATLAASRGGAGGGLRLGLLLGGLSLTRHVGAAVNAAVTIELAIRRRWTALASALAVATLIILPWAWWLVRTPRPTQLDLLPGRSMPEVIAGNAWFYVLRIPDSLSAPAIEVGTVFVPRAAPIASAVAIVAAIVLLIGLVQTLRADRRRLAGLVVVCNLGLLLVWPFTEAGRFLIPLVPPMLVVATEGIAAIVRRIGRKRPFPSPRVLAAWLLLAAAAPYSLYAAVSGRAEAERRSQGAVDPAFHWIARFGDRPGPLMTAYPAEAFWFTDRPGVVPPADPAAIADQIDQYRVAYLIVTEARFARATDDPLSRFVADHPDRVILQWSSDEGTIRVFEVIPPGSVSEPSGSSGTPPDPQTPEGRANRPAPRA